jgi:hypothetical protein
VALLLGNAQYQALADAAGLNIAKLPGMRFTLASEFLRNLGWTSFKPDRHVTEMFQMWFGSPDEQNLIVEADIAAISRVFGRTRIDRSDLSLLRTSLLGAKKTPPGTPINQSDQLVWLYRSTLGKAGVLIAEEESRPRLG